jgi:hypothetical protein
MNRAIALADFYPNNIHKFYGICVDGFTGRTRRIALITETAATIQYIPIRTFMLVLDYVQIHVHLYIRIPTTYTLTLYIKNQCNFSSLLTQTTE